MTYRVHETVETTSPDDVMTGDTKITNIIGTFDSPADAETCMVEYASKTYMWGDWMCQWSYFNGMKFYNFTDHSHVTLSVVKVDDSMMLLGDLIGDSELVANPLPAANTADSVRKALHALMPLIDAYNASALCSVALAESILAEANAWLSGYGVESITDRRNFTDALMYVNMGDSYATTLVYNTRTAEFAVTSWGDIIEADTEGNYHELIAEKLGAEFQD